MHVLHNIGNPQPPKYFKSWNSLLQAVREEKITGYAVDINKEVVNFRKGKRKSADGKKWLPV